MTKVTRRRLLAGCGATAAVIPFMRATPSSAGEGDFPRRLVFFHTPNDPMRRSDWEPDGEGSDFALPAQLPALFEPLGAHRDDLLIIGGLRMTSRDFEEGNGGHVGMGHQLTGMPNILWENQQQESEFWAGGISLDQRVAQHLGVEALTLAAVPRGTNGGCRISYLDANQPVDPYEDPAAAFATIFGDPTVPTEELLADHQRQMLALDHAALELEYLRPRLPSEDRVKVDAHVQHLLSLADELESFSPAECDPQAPEGGYSYGSSQDYPITARRQMDVLAQALACGVTQVGSLQNGNTGGAENYSGGLNWPSENISMSTSQHVVAHDYSEDPGDPTRYANRLTIEQFYTGQLAYLLDRLREVPEGDGTVLDNTLVVWTKSMGVNHSQNDMLHIVAGGRNIPGIDTGRFLDRTGIPHNDLLVTLANLMGLPLDSFGHEGACTGALPL